MMRYIAIIIIALLGMAELLVRATLMLLLAISVVGWVALVIIDEPGEMLEPWLFSIASDLAE
jgi:hypothetical protein